MENGMRLLSSLIIGLSVGFGSGCTESQDQAILLVRVEMHNDLDVLETICKETPDAELSGSACIEQMSEVTHRLSHFLTPKNAPVLQPISIRLDDMSKKLHQRHRNSQAK